MDLKSLIVLLGVLAVATASGNSLRTRRALDGGKCFWCRNGTPRWFLNCDCHEGWTGPCCTELETCSAESNHACKFSRLQERSLKCAQVADSYNKKSPLYNKGLRLGGKGLPDALKGVFWLQGQGDSSALTTFARSNDGGGLNQGRLTCSTCDDKGNNPNREANIKVRVGGDRVWSFNDKASSWVLVEALDLVYNFHFDNIKNPKRADIIPQSRNFGIKLEGWFAEALLNFDMELMEEKDKPAEYKDVVMWARPSQIVGIDGGYYELVQVIDGEGVPTAAFNKFVKYCEDKDETGKTPGTMWFREITN